MCFAVKNYSSLHPTGEATGPCSGAEPSVVRAGSAGRGWLFNVLLHGAKP